MPTAFVTAITPVISHIVNPILMFLIALGVFVFAYGVLQMIMNADSADARSTGQKHMLFGAIGMLIMVSAWGIIHLISSTLKGI